MSDGLTEDYEALTADAGAVWLRRDVVRASGPEAVAFLHGQLSQDVENLATGTSAWSFVLQPHGKVDSFVRLTRTGDDEILIDADAGQSEPVIERLNRFKLRTKVDLEPLEWKVLALRGPRSEKLKASGGVKATLNWPGVTGFDVIGEAPAVPAKLRVCGMDAYEAIRIEAGIPQVGAELDHLTIPAEAGVNDRAISYSKGCYTGQELVARIDSRGGNVPRHLRLVVIESEECPPRGSKIMPVGRSGPQPKPLGTLTSVAFSPRIGSAIALSLVRRDAIPPANATVVWDEGPTPCRIERLTDS